MTIRSATLPKHNFTNISIYFSKKGNWTDHCFVAQLCIMGLTFCIVLPKLGVGGYSLMNGHAYVT